MTLKNSIAVAIASACLVSVSGCSTTFWKNNSETNPTPSSESVTASAEMYKKMSVNSLFEEKSDSKNVTTDDYAYTLKYKTLSPSGVALTTEGYIHVLAYQDKQMPIPDAHNIKNRRELWEDTRINQTIKTSEMKEKPLTKKPSTLKKSEQDKEVPLNVLQAYKRFCNAAIGMTDQDWELIDQYGGIEGIPSTIKDCTPPK